MLKINCPVCETEFEIREDYLGRKLQCSSCNSKFYAWRDEKSGEILAEPLNQSVSKWIRCPHCWNYFDYREINYISRHIDLLGDNVLGPEAQSRFLPLRFSANGLAIDARGNECHEMACPRCHLKIVDTMVDLPTSFFSIVGSPASGKSYFLTAMIWQARKYLPKYFEYNMTDVDPEFNGVLNGYERTLFLSKEPDRAIALPKTELQGVGYSNQVLLDGVQVDLPRPFIFSLSPMPAHPLYATKRDMLERNVVFYDNAGEHFEPGRETASNLATLHLIYSDGIIFLYDPLQDMRFRSECSEDDPQVQQLESANQVTLFNEMTSRIRQFTGLHPGEKYRQPLVIVIAKFDALKDAFDFPVEEDAYIRYDEEKMEYYLDIQCIANVSFLLRQKMLDIAPDMVATAEAFSDTVYFVPASAFGCSPEVIEGAGQLPNGKNMLGIRPEMIKPLWIEVPFLLQAYLHGLIEGRICQVPDAEEIANYKVFEDSIVFAFPGSRTRVQLPANYSGIAVYCRENGKYYKVPAFEGDTPASAGKTAPLERQIDSDFWSRQ